MLSLKSCQVGITRLSSISNLGTGRMVERTSFRTWLRANRPMRTGVWEKPEISVSVPKVKRRAASTGAMPTMAMSMPNRPESRPLVRVDSDASAIMTSAQNTMANMSKLFSLRATSAMAGARNSRQR